MANENDLPYCCYIAPSGASCGKNAVWEIHKEQGTPDDYTQACDDHVSFLLYECNRVVLLEIDDDLLDETFIDWSLLDEETP